MYNIHYEPYALLHQQVDPFDFNEYDPLKIADEMIETMLKNNGIGLAANQIGLNARVFVMGSSQISKFTPQAFFNPVITKYSKETKVDKEGCLSFPGIFLNVKRPVWIEASYQDISGNMMEVKIDGYMSKAFQHEYDHLNGVCFVDRLSKLGLDMALRSLRKKTRRAGK
jgi:peptide deformylase